MRLYYTFKTKEKESVKIANYESAVIKTNSKRVRDMIIGIHEVCFFDLDFFEDSIYLKAEEGFTNDIISRITKEVKDTLIEIHISLESERYDKLYKINYLNGISKIHDIELQYHTSYFEKHINILESTKKGLKEEVLKTIENLCINIDTVKKDDNGNFKIEQNEDKKITIEFEIENLSIVATKQGGSVSLVKVEEIEYKDLLFIARMMDDNEDVLDIPF